MSQQWEYHQEVIAVNPSQITAVCNAAGRDGWEMVGMLPISVQPIQKLLTPGGSGANVQSAVLLQFKRPVGWCLEEQPQEETAGLLAGV